jgi:G3E family GTPase
MQPIPVTIFGGYLGSGKTTIILKALKQYRNPVKFAMIKNEYGDVNVDAELARAANIKVKEVINGCLCCILVGELNPGIEELVKTQQPERIIIEASGNALPFPIVRELKKNPLVYVDGVIVVVDCLNFDKIKDKSVVAREQAKYTDLIIFNKAGLVDENKLYQVKEEVFDLNPDTVKVETTDGVVDPRLLFGLTHTELPDIEPPHEHDHEMETFNWQSDKSLDQTKVEEVIKACNPNSFYRIKGIIKTHEGWKLLNSVFGRTDWQEMKDVPGDLSRIVFIGKGVTQWETRVKEFLDKA